MVAYVYIAHSSIEHQGYHFFQVAILQLHAIEHVDPSSRVQMKLAQSQSSLEPKPDYFEILL